MRALRLINAGGFILSMALSGSFVALSSGCDDGKKENTVVPATDPAKLQVEKDAREKFMKDAAAGKSKK